MLLVARLLLIELKEEIPVTSVGFLVYNASLKLDKFPFESQNIKELVFLGHRSHTMSTIFGIIDLATSFTQFSTVKIDMLTIESLAFEACSDSNIRLTLKKVLIILCLLYMGLTFCL